MSYIEEKIDHQWRPRPSPTPFLSETFRAAEQDTHATEKEDALALGHQPWLSSIDSGFTVEKWWWFSIVVCGLPEGISLYYQWIGVRDTFNQNPPYFMRKSMVSGADFPNKTIQWIIIPGKIADTYTYNYI